MNEPWLGQACPLCQNVFKPGDAIVSCSQCHTHHHKTCWDANSGCTTLGCQGKPIHCESSGGPYALPSGQIYCSHCGRMNQADAHFCNVCGQPIMGIPGPAPLTPAPPYQAVPSSRTYSFAQSPYNPMNPKSKEGMIQCPYCGKMIFPNVAKYGCGGSATQKVCPLCGHRIGMARGYAWCFIATAAYGSPLDYRVQILCKFRDHYLSKTKLGRAFIKGYYFISPQIAYYISLSYYLKSIVRSCLYPIVYFLELTIKSKND